MRNYYLGGAHNPHPDSEPSPAHLAETAWRGRGGGADLFLDVGGKHFGRFTFPDLAILLRGYATFADAGPLPAAEDVARTVRAHYRRHGELPVEILEGSFTLGLLDGRDGRVLLYRSLGGSGATYYCETPTGLLFASNLADLVDARATPPRANARAVPALFLYRSVPGRETLFDGVYRLIPGELVTWAPRHSCRQVQRQTLDDLRRPDAPCADPVRLIENTLGQVVADGAALRPALANLLSGGVDSSYLQVLANRASQHGGRLSSFSIHVDNPSGRGETEYALSASGWLGTRHTLVTIDRPYHEYLLETVAATAEPPNHVQTAYFGTLARSMAARGLTTGLCGEGADSLFGVESATLVQYARLLKRWLPLAALRGLAARLGAAVGWRGLCEGATLANHLSDWEDLRHPVNRVAVFTDWEAIHACFGGGAVAEALAYRRAMLTDYRVAPEPLEALHAAGYFGEGMETAALWTTLFNREGADLLCPFLDSRLMRVAVNLETHRRYPFRQPKGLLKRALCRHVPRELAYRRKRGFGQPIFEWLAPGGQLRPWVDGIGEYPFVDRPSLARAKARPNWFLYTLLCYDLWHKLFIDRSLPRQPRRRREHDALTR